MVSGFDLVVVGLDLDMKRFRATAASGLRIGFVTDHYKMPTECEELLFAVPVDAGNSTEFQVLVQAALEHIKYGRVWRVLLDSPGVHELTETLSSVPDAPDRLAVLFR